LTSAANADSVVPANGKRTSVTHFPDIDRSVHFTSMADVGSTVVIIDPLSNAILHLYKIRALYNDISGAMVFLQRIILQPQHWS
jgi:hypothetical protein